MFPYTLIANIPSLLYRSVSSRCTFDFSKFKGHLKRINFVGDSHENYYFHFQIFQLMHPCDLSSMQVLEETGCDVSRLLKMDDYIEVVIGQQRVRLYIITGVKEDTVFAPLTKKEISVSDLYQYVCIVAQQFQSSLILHALEIKLAFSLAALF